MCTFKEWFDENLSEYAEDISTHGCERRRVGRLMNKIIEACVVLFEGQPDVTLGQIHAVVDVMIDQTIDTVMSSGDRPGAYREIWKRLVS